MAFSNRHPHKKNSRPRPEVADREPETKGNCPDTLNISVNPITEELEDLASFKVFMKKNLAYQAPPKDLLASIYDRVDKIKGENSL